MSESGEGPSIPPQENRKLVPGSSERIARQRDNEAIYKLALQRVQTDNPQSFSLGSSIVGPGPGLRVDYYDLVGDPEGVVTVALPDSENESTLLLWKDNRSYRITKKDDTYDVVPESGFKWDKEGRREQELLTRNLRLTAKGRGEVLKVLNELPGAKRWYREQPQVAETDSE